MGRCQLRLEGLRDGHYPMILLEATATFVSVRDGAFHTSYRYLRERSVAGAYAMPAGATLGMVRLNFKQWPSDPTGNPENYLVWTYKCGSYVTGRAATAVGTPGVAMPSGSSNNVDAA